MQRAVGRHHGSRHASRRRSRTALHGHVAVLERHRDVARRDDARRHRRTAAHDDDDAPAVRAGTPPRRNGQACWRTVRQRRVRTLSAHRGGRESHRETNPFVHGPRDAFRARGNRRHAGRAGGAPHRQPRAVLREDGRTRFRRRPALAWVETPGSGRYPYGPRRQSATRVRKPELERHGAFYRRPHPQLHRRLRRGSNASGYPSSSSSQKAVAAST